MPNINRRSFLKNSALTVGGAFAFSSPAVSTTASGQILGANDRVRIGFAGVGSRGGALINEFGKIDNVEVAYIVDADLNNVTKRVGEIAEKTRKTPKGAQDIRVMLEDKDIDCVVIATIDVWHSLQTIWACQAGKDVYVEKPVSHRLFEGRKCAEAAQKYNRLVQHGTQRRSEDGWAKVAAAVQKEKYGKLVAVKVYANRPRGPLGFKPIQPAPANLNWEQWLGPAPVMDYHANLHPYNWHWFWDTGNGEIVNNGVHFFDLCLWALNKTHPKSVMSFGSRFVKDPANNYKDQAQTPTILFALYDFDGIPVIHETCNIAGPRDKWNPLETTEFYTEKGVLRGDTFIPNGGAPEKVEIDYVKPSPGGPFANFINAVRNRNSVPLNAPISKGYHSASIPHWANAAYKTGKRESFKTCREKMGDNPFLQETIDKVAANFKEVFGESVTIDDVPFQISEKLLIDAEKEQFINNPEANQFLTRVPRQPFAIPDQV